MNDNSTNFSPSALRDNHQEQITHFQDDVSQAMYTKPMTSTMDEWVRMAGDAQVHELKSILERPVEILNGELSSTDVDEVVIGTFPNAIINASSTIQSKLAYFEYFRADVHIRFMANAMPFQSGRYWLYFSPYDTECNRGRTGSFANMTGYPGVEIDLASSTPVEIVIPYCAPLSHYNLVTRESTMGEAILYPLAAVASSESNDNVPFSIFAWFENIDLVLPTSKTISQGFVAQAFVGENEDQPEDPIVAGVKQVATGAIQKIVPVEPSWVSRFVNGVAGMIGFNKPVHLQPTQAYANIPGKGFTNMDGKDNSTVLGASSDVTIHTMPGIFSTDVDEMSFDYVKKKSCLMKAPRSWITGGAQGRILDSIPVTPGYCDATSPTTVANPTTLAYLSSMFRYWRGGITYRFSFAKTAFHSGRLRFAFVPKMLNSSPIVSGGEPLYMTHNWVIDLSKSSEITFTIPYCSNRAWMPVEVISNDANLAYRDSSTGWLVIQVLTPLKKASNASDTVKYMGWISGADDFELAVPDFATYVPSTIAPLADIPEETPAESEFVAQVFQEASEDISHNEQVQNIDSAMFPDKTIGNVTASGLSIGEKITSLRQLIKRFGPMFIGYPYPYKQPDSVRYSLPGPVSPDSSTEKFSLNSIQLDPAYFGEVDTDQSAFATYSLPIEINPNPVQAPAEANCIIGRKLPPTSPLHYISYLYRFYRGGRRYKIWTAPARIPKVSSQAWSAPLDDSIQPDNQVPTNWLHGYEYENSRTSIPYLVTRDKELTTNGNLTGPTVQGGYKPTQQAVFESIHYPDINGCVEVEVPYYSGLPISLVAEKSLPDSEGPLVERSRVNFTLGTSVQDLEIPYPAVKNSLSSGAEWWCLRGSIGSCRVYTAAADDFSFGYLVGAPKLVRSNF
nr:hypothetical protein 2 [Beihai picorna-like virus 74]